ncbi:MULTISPECIES: VOC family protein [Natrialbaceae]|uniref:VOC family protein n=1 Tax=Natrialbaceae TaxID=1644061 RepID=UPI00207C674C|nr:VOC family protein [Natronococcus sp. CG52]
MEIQHSAMQVSDLEATKSFYENGLGLEYAWDFHTDEGVHNYYVTGDELDTWIQFVHDPDKTEPIDPSGFAHLGILVDDTDDVFNQLCERTDCPVIKEPTTVDAANARVAFVKDPDGYEVEVFHTLH